MSNGVSEQVAATTINYLQAVDIAADERRAYQGLGGSAVITKPDRDLVITLWGNREQGSRNLRRKRELRWHSPAPRDA